MCACVCVLVFMCVHTSVYDNASKCMNVCQCGLCIYTLTNTHTYIHIYIYICVCVCLFLLGVFCCFFGFLM